MTDSKSNDSHRPGWAPPNAGPEFAVRIVPGSTTGTGPSRPSVSKRRSLSVEDYIDGVKAGDRTILARAITLVESNSPAHLPVAQAVLNQLLPSTGKAIRVGITGVPGVGKSTFIEALGMHLTAMNKKVAVLAVDPSSSLTRGSILGDKTRMEKLARNPACFIRPSPSGGTLGGVARKSRETMLLCEAAGYDIILVETVGVGQSETTVRSMVDFFLLLALTGAGDELQGIKKGIMELADAIIINKADGENKIRAAATRREYNNALHYLHPATDGWQTEAHTCSAMTGEGIPAIWSLVERFTYETDASGVFAARRKRQTLEWMHSLLEDELKQRFFRDPRITDLRRGIEDRVVAGELTVTAAVQNLLAAYDRV